MIVKLLIEHHLEFLSTKGDCRGSSESTHVNMPHCWKSHAFYYNQICFKNTATGTGAVLSSFTLFIYEASNSLVDDKKNIHFVIMRFKG